MRQLIIDIIGVLAVVCGACLIHPGLGLIMAGLLMLVLAWELSQ